MESGCLDVHEVPAGSLEVLGAGYNDFYPGHNVYLCINLVRGGKRSQISMQPNYGTTRYPYVMKFSFNNSVIM